MARTFRHVTGRSLRVAEGSRTERLVEADDNWTTDEPDTTPAAEEAPDGSGNDSGSGGKPRASARSRRKRSS